MGAEPDIKKVSLDLLPHEAAKVREYCTGADLDTDVDVSAIETSMDDQTITLPTDQWFDLTGVMRNIESDGWRPRHYARRIMRKVYFKTEDNE